MTRFKILSDFDGVWTRVDREADEIHRHLVERCAGLVDRSPSAVEEDFIAIRHEVARDPSRFGWAPDGRRVSAFSDEDPLCWIAGICQRIGMASPQDPRAYRYRQAIESVSPSVAAFAEEGFVTAMRRFRVDHEPAIAPDAREQLRAVTSAGAEVVVCSNSEPSKLIEWFAAVGVDAGEGPDHELRIRGSACKHIVHGEQTVDVGGRRVLVDRPHYRQAIEQERPHLVIGDIFSLDLSLPYAMRQSGHPLAPRRLALRRHPETPSWILDTRHQGVIDHVVDRFADLAAVVQDTVET